MNNYSRDWSTVDSEELKLLRELFASFGVSAEAKEDAWEALFDFYALRAADEFKRQQDNGTLRLFPWEPDEYEY